MKEVTTMSVSESVCRVCLAGGVRMHEIKDSNLLETYEKLTSSKLITENQRLSTICYICHRQLQRCWRFSDTAHKSDRILRNLLQAGNEVTHSTIASLNLGATQQLLSFTNVQHVSTDNSDSSESQVRREFTSRDKGHEYYVCVYNTIKVEGIAVKEETITSEEVLDEIESRDLDKCDAAGDSLKKEQTSTKGSNESTSDNEDFNLHCDKCSKTFDKLLNFKVHLRTHTKRNSYSCPSCNKMFNYAGLLNRHMRSHVKSYVCDRCSKKFKLKSGLEAHMRTHTGEKPFGCEVCGKTFNQRSHLTTHMKTHTDVKPFRCETCGKSFRQRAQLISHERSHTGERPFSCNRCEMTFGHLTTLRKHMRLHTEVKNYPCDQCSMSFNQECALTRHMRIHTAERPHACLICNKSFREARHLKDHVQCVHSGTRPHVCACGNTFKRPDNLKQHARSSKCKASFTGLSLADC